jgi:hypothetical protein
VGHLVLLLIAHPLALLASGRGLDSQRETTSALHPGHIFSPAQVAGLAGQNGRSAEVRKNDFG